MDEQKLYSRSQDTVQGNLIELTDAPDYANYKQQARSENPSIRSLASRGPSAAKPGLTELITSGRNPGHPHRSWTVLYPRHRSIRPALGQGGQQWMSHSVAWDHVWCNIKLILVRRVDVMHPKAELSGETVASVSHPSKTIGSSFAPSDPLSWEKNTQIVGSTKRHRFRLGHRLRSCSTGNGLLARS